MFGLQGWFAGCWFAGQFNVSPATARKQVLINRDVVRPPPSASDGFDVSLIGDADVVTAHLAAAIGLSVPAEHGGKAPAPSREPISRAYYRLLL